MGIRDILKHPAIYQGFQNAGGFFGARIKGLAAYAPLKGGEVVVDVGCGPGYIVEHLPKSVRYFGFDTDPTYIAYAQQRFGDRGTFHCRIFNEDAAASIPAPDLVMMNGVVHHLDDGTAEAVFHTIRRVLKPEGRLFTLDGCFREGQSSLAAYLLRNDRGEFVRNEAEYNRLLSSHFARVDIHVREDLSRIPYTFAIGIASGSLAK